MSFADEGKAALNERSTRLTERGGHLIVAVVMCDQLETLLGAVKKTCPAETYHDLENDLRPKLDARVRALLGRDLDDETYRVVLAALQ